MSKRPYAPSLSPFWRIDPCNRQLNLVKAWSRLRHRFESASKPSTGRSPVPVGSTIQNALVQPTSRIIRMMIPLEVAIGKGLVAREPPGEIRFW